MGLKGLISLEDCKLAFSLFCCVYGIGTLGMPTNYSRAGPVFASVALVIMAFANVYATVLISRLFLLAPPNVRTLGDLAEWCGNGNKYVRYVMITTQMGVCLLVPCAFLTLGGQLLVGLFPETFSKEVWIVFLALSILPVCLTPTLKEGAWAALAGCLGTLLADALGIILLLYGMRGHTSVPTPELSVKETAMTFGNLALAYGAGIVVPALQRQHSDPRRFPRVVFFTLTLISVLYLLIATLGYSAMGCQISDNLLFTIFPDKDGFSALHFKTDRAPATLAYLGMWVHVTVAFAVVTYPAFYLFERIFIGMHKHNDFVLDAPESHVSVAERASKVNDSVQTPEEPRVPLESHYSRMNPVYDDDEDADIVEYKTTNKLKYSGLRITVVVIQATLSAIFADHFGDLTDFTGALCNSTSCVIMPCVLFLLARWKHCPWYEKFACLFIIIVCSVLCIYVTIESGINLFSPKDESPDDPVYPYCKPENQFYVYYNATSSE